MSVNITQRTLWSWDGQRAPGSLQEPRRRLMGQLRFPQFQLFHTGELEESNRSIMVRASSPWTLGTVTYFDVNEDVSTLCCILIILINLLSALLDFVN